MPFLVEQLHQSEAADEDHAQADEGVVVGAPREVHEHEHDAHEGPHVRSDLVWRRERRRSSRRRNAKKQARRQSVSACDAEWTL